MFPLYPSIQTLGIANSPIDRTFRAALIVAIPSRHDELRTAAHGTGLSIPVIGPEDSIPAPAGGGIVADLLEGEAQEAALLYTSGTTGNPKGCVLPNTYFLLAGEWYRNAGGLAQLQEAGERMITPLPVFHMNAMAYSFMAMVTVGVALLHSIGFIQKHGGQM